MARTLYAGAGQWELPDRRDGLVRAPAERGDPRGLPKRLRVGCSFLEVGYQVLAIAFS